MDVPKLLSVYIRRGATVLDVGCGEGSPFAKADLIASLHLTGIDSHRASLDIVIGAGYENVIVGELPDAVAALPTGSYDYVTALDVIEHLPKELGRRLAAEMKRVARVSAIVVTPVGFLPQDGTVENEAQRHLSGWIPRDLRELGYSRFVGINGWGRLRGPYGQPSLRPRRLGSALAGLSAPVFERFPSQAFQFAAMSGFPRRKK